MDEFIQEIRDDLKGVMTRYSVSRAKLAAWCDVSEGSVARWRHYKVPDGRAHQIAYEISRHRKVDVQSTPSPTRIIQTLKWYADHTQYFHDSETKLGGLPEHYSEDAVTVYRRRIMNDRGARARAALEEVGHE